MTAAPIIEPIVSPLRDHPRVPLTPTAARRLLRFELEWLVAETGVTHAMVASWLGVSRASVTQALSGKNLLSRPAIEVLCSRLGRIAWFPRLSSMLAVARHKTTEPDVAAVTGQRDSELVLGLEAFADRITVFDPWLVPVHLRTQMYAAALTKLDAWTQDQVGELRRAPLTDDRDPLAFRWVTSEHAFRRRIGGTPVMDDQRAFLLELAGRSNVDIRIIPAQAELPVNPFQLVHGTPPVVVEPTRLALHYTFDVDAVTHFEDLVERLQRRALSPEDSVTLIRGM
ncbi:DUF5753 domain-containing protein [Actinokineospora sp. 24-640]